MKATGKVIFSAMLFALMTVFGFTGEASAESFAPQEIYNQDGVKISVTGSEENSTRTTIKFLIENNREENIRVESKDLSVNGYATKSPSIYLDVDAGKKNSDPMIIDKDDFELQEVDTIATVEFSLDILDNETWDTIGSPSEPIQLVSEGNENYVQEYDDSGEVLYDKEGIKVISKGIVKDWTGTKLSIYVENNSEKSIGIRATDTSINDFMVGDSTYIDVPSEKHAMGYMQFFVMDLEEYQIETFEEIETTLQIVYIEDNHQTLYESVPTIISFQ